MFDRNGAAFPTVGCDNPAQEEPGLTKFEQCAKDFTAAALPYTLRFASSGTEAMQDAVKWGLQTAEEFCKQMEEREKGESKVD